MNIEGFEVFVCIDLSWFGTGVKKEDSLSPSLFNHIMNKIRDSTRGIGYNKINIIYYADDVLIATNEDDLQGLLYGFRLSCKKFPPSQTCIGKHSHRESYVLKVKDLGEKITSFVNKLHQEVPN